MAAHEIIAYIEKELKNGFHIDDIKRVLLHVGHDRADVEEAAAHVGRSHAEKARRRNILSFLIPVVAFVFLLLALYFFLR